MHFGRVGMALLQSGDCGMPFESMEYDLHQLDITGMPFDSVTDFVKETSATAILVDVPEEAEDAIRICRRLKSDPDFGDFPLIALLQFPSSSIVMAVIEAGVDEAVLLPTTERVIAERLERWIPNSFPVEATMTESASSSA